MPRVLMVDTAVLFRMLEGSFLRREGWEIVCAARGTDVIDKARTLRPEIVLLDATAPGLDARACLRALREEPRPVPVVMLTDAGNDPRGGEGADAVLTHPVEAAALESALCELGQVPWRRGARRAARLTARVTTAEGLLRGRVKDISRTGIFLTLPRPLPIDSAVGLSLILPAPEGPRRVQAQGIVVRRVAEESASHLIAGVGVRFTSVDERSGSLIDRFVSQAAPRGEERADQVTA
jgi:CheY-like chemotaxis protein